MSEDALNALVARLNDGGYTIIKNDEFEEALERAAHRGAKRALEGVGLHDEDAGNDIRDMRSLMGSYRVISKAFWTSFAKIIVWGFLALIASFGLKTGIIDAWTGK